MRQPQHLVLTICLLAAVSVTAAVIPPKSKPPESDGADTGTSLNLSPEEASTRDPEPVAMTQRRLEELLRNMSSEHEGSGGAMRFVFQGVLMVCVSDPAADRMRLIAPIIEAEKMTDEQRRKVLDANFHTALDARYATSDGVLYSAFIHPLSPLSPGELSSAVEQVANLARTFGTAYTSGVFTYGTPGE